jgi:hypothetical protein
MADGQRTSTPGSTFLSCPPRNHLLPGILICLVPVPNLTLFSSYLCIFTSWVQGPTRRLLASITIVDYTGAIGETFTIATPPLPASLRHWASARHIR